MKKLVLLSNYFYPRELEQAISDFVEYFNYQRYHESLQNLTPKDVYFSREKEVLSRREQIKQQTLAERRVHHFKSIQMYNAR